MGMKQYGYQEIVNAFSPSILYNGNSEIFDAIAKKYQKVDHLTIKYWFTEDNCAINALGDVQASFNCIAFQSSNQYFWAKKSGFTEFDEDNGDLYVQMYYTHRYRYVSIDAFVAVPFYIVFHGMDLSLHIGCYKKKYCLFDGKFCFDDVYDMRDYDKPFTRCGATFDIDDVEIGFKHWNIDYNTIANAIDVPNNYDMPLMVFSALKADIDTSRGNLNYNSCSSFADEVKNKIYKRIKDFLENRLAFPKQMMGDTVCSQRGAYLDQVFQKKKKTLAIPAFANIPIDDMVLSMEQTPEGIFFVINNICTKPIRLSLSQFMANRGYDVDINMANFSNIVDYGRYGITSLRYAGFPKVTITFAKNLPYICDNFPMGWGELAETFLKEVVKTKTIPSDNVVTWTSPYTSHVFLRNLFTSILDDDKVYLKNTIYEDILNKLLAKAELLELFIEVANYFRKDIQTQYKQHNIEAVRARGKVRGTRTREHIVGRHVVDLF